MCTNDDSEGPSLNEYEVFLKIKRAKKPNSTVKHDLPPILVKEFAPELSKPVCEIFNSITKSGTHPRQWVKEEQIGFPKHFPLKGIESLRSLSKTSFFSKV